MNIEELKKDIQKYFDKGGAHSFDHTQRVYNLAMNIAKGEKVDLEVLEAAILLHDISRLKQWRKEIECHAEEGAKMIPEILRKHGFPEEKIEKVVHCVRVHRKSQNLESNSIEAEILQDADRLDILGAIGIMRTISHSYRLELFDPNEKEPQHFKFKDKSQEPKTILNWLKTLTFLDPSTFRIEKAKEMCKERLTFLKDFINHFEKEWVGEL